MSVIVGTSGWQYDDWRDALYGSTPKAKWLEAFAERFRAVEVNNTFYRLPAEETFASWRDRTPDGFVFAIKASRFITHVRRLADVGEPITVLIERASGLGRKLGPILYQLPPSLHRDDELLRGFLDGLPPYPKAAIEFRHESWFDDAVFSMMRDHDVALCVAHEDPASSTVLRTASWAYFRLHGGPGFSQYADEQNAAIAGVVANVAAEADSVCVFFDNDTAGAAVHDATALMRNLAATGVKVRGEAS